MIRPLRGALALVLSVVFACCALPLAAPAFAATITLPSASSDALWTADQAAKSGDVILAPAGTYMSTWLTAQHAAPGVTIMPVPGATVIFPTLGLAGSGKILSGITMQLPPKTQYGVEFSGCTNCGFINGVIGPAATPTADSISGAGIFASQSPGLILTGNDIGWVGAGIGLEDTDATVHGNTLHDIGTHGILATGMSGGEISGNHLLNFHVSIASGHPDKIHLANSAKGSSVNVLIKDNLGERGTGDIIQGILLEDTRGVQVLHNAELGGDYNGIADARGEGDVMAGNLVLGYVDHGSQIIVRQLPTNGDPNNIQISGNTTTQAIGIGTAGEALPIVTQSGNVQVSPAAVNDNGPYLSWLGSAVTLPAPAPPPLPASAPDPAPVPAAPAPDPLQVALDAATAKVAADDAQLAADQVAIINLTNQLQISSTAQAATAAQLTTSQGQVTDLQAQLAAAPTPAAVAALNGQVSALKAQIAALPAQATVDGLTAQLAALQKQYSALQGSTTAQALKTAQSALAALQAKVKTAGTDSTTWAAKVANDLK